MYSFRSTSKRRGRARKASRDRGKRRVERLPLIVVADSTRSAKHSSLQRSIVEGTCNVGTRQLRRRAGKEKRTSQSSQLAIIRRQGACYGGTTYSIPSHGTLLKCIK